MNTIIHQIKGSHFTFQVMAVETKPYVAKTSFLVNIYDLVTSPFVVEIMVKN